MLEYISKYVLDLSVAEEFLNKTQKLYLKTKINLVILKSRNFIHQNTYSRCEETSYRLKENIYNTHNQKN